MTRPNAVVLFALICAVSSMTPDAVAVPVNYSEAISGDLSSSNPLANLVFDIGINTISGTFGTPTDVITDSDSFALIVPAGMQIFSGSLVLSDNTGNILDSTWNLNAGSASLGGGVLVEVANATSPGAYLFTALPLGANTYNVTHAYFSSLGANPNLANFTFQFGVRQLVPEPASAAIALTAFGCALGFRTRRRR